MFRPGVGELRTRSYRGDGFTVVELLLVVAILGITATVAYPSYQDYRERARVAQAITDIGGLNAKVRLYMTDNREPPLSLSEVGAAGMRDPWGNEYVYQNLAVAGGPGKSRKNKNLTPINTDFDLYSKGKDGLSKLPLTAQASRDDVILANDGRFIGLASKYDP